MDILEQEFPDKVITNLMNKLKFKNNKIKLGGSAGLKSQLYSGDYDFISIVINKKYTMKDIYNEFKKILKDVIYKTNNIHTYFIEFKIQFKNGDKIKINSIDDITENNFINYKLDNIEYFKIDLVAYIYGYFKEISCIYNFNNNISSKKDNLKSLEKDYNEYFKEGNYYKALKRLMAIEKIKNNKNEVIKLTNFFNSKIGELYMINSEIDAYLLFNKINKINKGSKDKYFKIFTDNIGLKDITFKNLIRINKEYKTLINDEAFNFYIKEL
jgi:hypothetical protein